MTRSWWFVPLVAAGAAGAVGACGDRTKVTVSDPLVARTEAPSSVSCVGVQDAGVNHLCVTSDERGARIEVWTDARCVRVVDRSSNLAFDDLDDTTDRTVVELVPRGKRTSFVLGKKAVGDTGKDRLESIVNELSTPLLIDAFDVDCSQICAARLGKTSIRLDPTSGVSVMSNEDTKECALQGIRSFNRDYAAAPDGSAFATFFDAGDREASAAVADQAPKPAQAADGGESGEPAPGTGDAGTKKPGTGAKKPGTGAAATGRTPDKTPKPDAGGH